MAKKTIGFSNADLKVVVNLATTGDRYKMTAYIVEAVVLPLSKPEKQLLIFIISKWVG